MATELHKIQRSILVRLLMNSSLRFTELNKGKTSSDRFTFHLKKLITDKLVTKNGEGGYELTTIGKEFANRFDTKTKSIERQAKIGLRICCVKGEGKDRQYLLEQRLKQPYWGYWGFPGGKIRWGETIYEAAARELKEETGLSGEIVLSGIKHKMDYDTSENMLEDKFFFVFKVENPKGKLKETYESGRNKWLKRKEIKKIEKSLFVDVNKALDLVEGDDFWFSENKYKVEGY